MYTPKERAARFQDAREQYNRHGKQSMREVERATGVQASMISYLENYDADRQVNYQSIITLAEHYGVSADYLLGLSDTPSIADDSKIASKVTGLTGRAIDRLRWIMKDNGTADILDKILRHGELTNLLRYAVEARRQVAEIKKTYANLGTPSLDNEAEWRECQRRLWHTRRDFEEAVAHTFAVRIGTKTAGDAINKALEAIAKERSLMEDAEDREFEWEQEADNA